VTYDSERELGKRERTDSGPARGRNFGPSAVPPGGLYERERRFVSALLELLQGGHPLSNATITCAGRAAFRFGNMTEESADRKALDVGSRMLANPNVTAHLTDLFAAAGFKPSDAAELHVKHIKAGNYQALRDYWKMITPQTPKQIEMKAAVMSMTPDEFLAARVPTAMVGRTLGKPPGEFYEQAEPPSPDATPFYLDGSSGSVIGGGADADSGDPASGQLANQNP